MGSKLHADDLVGLAGAASRADLLGQLTRIMRRLEFDRVAMQLFVDGRPEAPDSARVDNLPAAYLDEWALPAEGAACPVMQHLKRHHTAIVYGQGTYTRVNAGHLWESQAPFGFASGVAVALHLPNGRHLALGMGRDRDVKLRPEAGLRLACDIHLTVAHCAEPALTLLDESQRGNEVCPRLTGREREVLQWTLLGKSASMTADITGLSFSTVNFHLRNAMLKLGCHNKHMAACRAQALGLISG